MDEQGVASPTLNRDTGFSRLMKRDTGILTQNAPTIPWIMTNSVSGSR